MGKSETLLENTEPSEVDLLGLKAQSQGRLDDSVGLASNFSSGHDLAVREFEPHVGLCADSSEPEACFGFWVSLSLSLCLTHSHSVCLSLKNKTLKNFFNAFYILSL